MPKLYREYPNDSPNSYTVHLDIYAEGDRAAVAKMQEIVQILAAHNIFITIPMLTDTDDWAEHVHADDHPNAVRVGVGRRVVLDENGHLMP